MPNFLGEILFGEKVQNFAQIIKMLETHKLDDSGDQRNTKIFLVSK